MRVVRVRRQQLSAWALGSTAVLFAGCTDEGATLTRATSAAEQMSSSHETLSEELTREGFAALRMSEDERAVLAAAIEASDWAELPASAFPEHIRRFDGVAARIEGWMIPGTIKQRRVLDFMLVRDNAACCFGAMPGADEWIHVEMAPGTSAEYWRYAKIAVEGRLTVGGAAVIDGMQPPALRLFAHNCEIIEKPR